MIIIVMIIIIIIALFILGRKQCVLKFTSNTWLKSYKHKIKLQFISTLLSDGTLTLHVMNRSAENCCRTVHNTERQGNTIGK